MDRIKELLIEEVESEISKLSDLEMGSDEYKTSVNGIKTLADVAIDLEKIEVDSQEKEKNRELEMQKVEKELFDKKQTRELEEKLKLEQTKENKKDRLFTNGVTILGIALPVVVTIWGTLKTLKFEETGTVTTMMGRGFINKLLPKK